MSYKSFLIAMCQLAGKKRARVEIDGNLIFIEATKEKNRWNLNTKIFAEDGYIPPSIRSCVSSAGYLRWQNQGPYLKLDPLSHSVFLIHEVAMEEGKYLSFRRVLSDFVQAASEWREILQEFAEKDHAPISNRHW